MKLWTLSTSLTVSLLLLSGCGATGTPSPEKQVKVDESLPIIKLTRNGVISDMRSIAFEWQSISNPNVKGIYIYKKVPNKDNATDTKLEYYDTIENRFQTHYVDNDVEPNSVYRYAFKTFSENTEGRQSEVIEVKTLPVLQSVSWITTVQDMPRSAKILWRPHSSERVHSYIIERKTLQDPQWKELAVLNGRLNAEYLDNDLEDNYVYMYRVFVVTYDGIKSAPSKVVKVITKALPKRIENIRASADMPRAIKIEWDPSKEKDFDRYYLYRSDTLDGSYELIAKLYNNSYIDKIDEDAKSYFYRVSAVDKAGLISKNNDKSIQGITLIKPTAPAFVEAHLIDSKIELQWSRVDPRSVSYTVTKKRTKGWFKTVTQDIEGIKDERYNDTDIEPASRYEYTVYSVDKYGIKSEPSISVEVETPEAEVIVDTAKETVEKKAQETTQKVEQKVSQTIESEVIAPTEDLDLSGL
jgi:fibronectin type 3 domain-containing protein